MVAAGSSISHGSFSEIRAYRCVLGYLNFELGHRFLSQTKNSYLLKTLQDTNLLREIIKVGQMDSRLSEWQSSVGTLFIVHSWTKAD